MWREEQQVGKLKNGRELGLMDIADRAHSHWAVGPGSLAENAYHCLPHLSPWEPIFHAVDDAQDLRQLDIITDRGNLRKLFRLALGDYLPKSQSSKRVWRFDAEVVGSTVILHRWETRSKRTPYPLDKNGFGVAYHLAKTSSVESNERTDVVTATQGLVRYRFGGLNLLVRFDIDTVLPEDPAAPGLAPTPLFSSGAIKTSSLVVKRYSCPPISHERLLHIATRCLDGDRPEDDSEFTGQLVFSQTPQFGIARHRAGDFSEGDVTRYRLDKPPLNHRVAAFDWVLRRVAGLLRQIVDAVRQREDLAFVCEKGKLSMYERTLPLVALSTESKTIFNPLDRSREPGNRKDLSSWKSTAAVKQGRSNTNAAMLDPPEWLVVSLTLACADSEGIQWERAPLQESVGEHRRPQHTVFGYQVGGCR